MTLIAHRPRQPIEMADLQRSRSDQGNSSVIPENGSYRSRASSVISTGTKFSISTMPPGHFHIDGVLEGSNRWSTRPTSLYSVRSTAPSLPPYEAHPPLDAVVSSSPQCEHLVATQPSMNRDHQSMPSGGNSPEQPLTPSDPENALSMHYGRVVRTIDENHARQLARLRQDHEQDLAATRNAVDEAYRKEFKSKNREIERIREEAANEIEQIRHETTADVAATHKEIKALSLNHDETVMRIQRENAERLMLLHEEHQAATEKARHAVEDLWEGRWNDRAKLAAQEAERRDAERDAQWLIAIRRLHPELADEIMKTMQIF